MKKVTKACLACLVMLSIVIGSVIVGNTRVSADDVIEDLNARNEYHIQEGQTLAFKVPNGATVTVTLNGASDTTGAFEYRIQGDTLYITGKITDNLYHRVTVNVDPNTNNYNSYYGGFGIWVDPNTDTNSEGRDWINDYNYNISVGDTIVFNIPNGAYLGDNSTIREFMTLDIVGNTLVITGIKATGGQRVNLHSDPNNNFLGGFQVVVVNSCDTKGHTEVLDAAVPATCTETGLTEGKHCSVCGAVIVAQEVIPALGHTEEPDAAVPATCTEAGKTAGSHCSVCGAVIVAQEVDPALGHTAEPDAAVPATCTEAGKTAGSHCSVCDAVIVAQEVIPALGHKAEPDAAVPATCTEAGKTAGSHCSVCDAVIVAQEVVPALGHKEVIVEAVAPTCTETGLTEGSHCSVCNAVLEEQEEVPALGHDWDNGVVTTAPTLETPGVRTFTCQNDNSHLRTEEIPVLTPAPEEDPEDDDSSTPEDNNSSTPEDNNSSTPEDNNSSTPEDNNSSAPVDNNSSTPAEESSDAPQVTPPVQPQQPEQEVQGAVVDKPENSVVAPETSTPVVAPVENNTTTSKPDTGDHSQPVLYMMLMMIAVVGMIVVKKATKKKSYR